MSVDAARYLAKTRTTATLTELVQGFKLRARDVALTFTKWGVTVRRMRVTVLASLFLTVNLIFSSLPSDHAARAGALAAEPMSVVVTIPVLKDLADRVGGVHVRTISLLTGNENEHTYSPKPSDLIAIERARVLLEIGLGLEIWVRSLINNSGNSGLVVVTTSKGIALVRRHDATDEPQQSVQRRPDGNPHVWLDPENAKIMLRHITDAFSKVDPAHAVEYRKNQAGYLAELDQVQTDLMNRTRGIRDRRIVAHHPAWPYFARRFGFTIVGEIVTQPGAEPSPRHVQNLITRIRKDQIRVIVSEPQLNRKVPEMLARETGARVVVLTALPGALAGTDSYLDMLRYNVLQLARAFEPS
jgi:ABC-type Zn uptake system ZnuABC Zn-binding protein ZnuA